jgi:hypothetical protein
VRTDSAFYSRAVLGTAVKLDVDFSVTARIFVSCRAVTEIRAAIEAMEEDAWEPSRTGCRPQLTLFTTWDHHAFVTNRTGEVTEVEADHRRHAVVEQRTAELTGAGLAHLPSGTFMANAAWRTDGSRTLWPPGPDLPLTQIPGNINGPHRQNDGSGLRVSLREPRPLRHHSGV